MEEFTGTFDFLTGSSVSSGVQESLDLVADVSEEIVPDVVVNVKNLGDSSMNISSFLSQYFSFFSEYSDMEIIISFVIIFLWIFCVIRVLRDSTARSDSSFYQFFSVFLVVLLTPVVGLPIYLAFRPLVYKWDRGLWRESLESHISICPHCGGLNDENHKMCTWCGESLHVECKQCHHSYLGQYSYCPECGAPNLE